LVVCGAPICAQSAPLLIDPLKRLGIEVRRFNAGTTPSAITSTMNSVVASNPSVVIVFAVPSLLWQQQLASLAAKNVPVITSATDPPKGTERDFTATLFTAAERRRFGEHLANFVTADSGGRAGSMYIWTPELAGLKSETDGYTSTLTAKCASCTVDVMTTKTADIGRGLPRQIVSALQRKPDTKYVVLMTGDMATGVPEAIKAAGLSGVKLISASGGPTNYQYIRRGQQYADLAQFIGVHLWQIADAAARAVSGRPQVNPALPTQWITSRNDNFKQLPPFGTDYEEEFLKLWGLQQ
jgi:ribose transport system substrate-binding protein